MSGYLKKENIIFQLANLKQLTFEVTDTCNLKCKYCAYGEFYNDYDKREENYLSVNRAIKIINYLNEYWNSSKNISFKQNTYIGFYGGEPLLNMPFIRQIVDYIENLKTPQSFTFAITTNAILLHKFMDFLADKKFNLLISLDGNEFNTSYRVDHANKPVFKKIMQNVALLREKYPDYFEQNVNFNAVLHNRNSVGEIYTFFKENFNKIPSIGELNESGIKPEKQDIFMHAYRNVMESLHQAENYKQIEKEMFIKSASYQTVSTYLMQYSGFVFDNYNELLFGTDNIKRIPTGTCIPFAKKMFVTVNGKILPCERIGHQYAAGYVDDKEVSIDFEGIVNRYNAYYKKLENQCSRCYNQKACVQCVFYLKNLDEKPVCEGFMNEQLFKQYEKQQLDFLSENPEDYFKIMKEVLAD
jgi:uncharacterized protein